MADKTMLIVLDNARDSDQVRPLLPGARDCRVLVTSRSRFTSLIAAEGAHLQLQLHLLALDEARDLLACRLGPARPGPGRGRTARGRPANRRLRPTPLALAIVAANAATHQRVALTALADQLHRPDRLDALFTGDDPATDLRAAFSWSYGLLSDDSARLFRLLGLHPGPDISLAAAASLAALPIDQVRPLLNTLARAHLINEHTPGRYAFHDLLRVYAAEQAHHIEPDEQRHAGTSRTLDHYLHTAHTAARLLHPSREPLPLTPPQPGATPEALTDHQQALTWFTAEHAVLLAAIDHAAATGFDTHTWQLGWTLYDYLQWRGERHHLDTALHAAVAAATRLGDPSAKAHAHT